MAKRLCFVSTPNEKSMFREVEVEFKYYSGFALSQKRKNIASMHQAIEDMGRGLNVLEISTKSPNPVGVALSAFNLAYEDKITGEKWPVENVFQSSKVFEYGGPYRDLIRMHPKEAKRDERLRNSGKLTGFQFDGMEFALEPKTMFYDWVYMSALNSKKDIIEELIKYNAFTDIEFNHTKSINCQARAAAIFVSLYKLNSVDRVLKDMDELKNLYVKPQNASEQLHFPT